MATSFAYDYCYCSTFDIIVLATIIVTIIITSSLDKSSGALLKGRAPGRSV